LRRIITSDLDGVADIEERALVSAELRRGLESLVSDEQLRLEGLLACAGEGSDKSHVKASLGILGFLQQFVSQLELGVVLLSVELNVALAFVGDTSGFLLLLVGSAGI
jgi:hypothetical protein